MAPPKDSRALPPKEEALFRQVLQQYESKNFKKAIKTADQILKKYPNNGQTISMKALVLFHSPANPELKLTQADNERDGLVLGKQGVAKDPDSQLCWHILGMLQRAKKEYALASKSFGQALKADPHSQQILRDNAHLSLHLRNYQTHLANRLLLFQMRPNERKSWHSLALAYYLLGDLDSFEKVLGGLLEGVQRVPSEGRVEESEVREWRVRGLVESGKWADALEALDKGVREEEIVNREEAGILRAEILRNLGKKDEAEDAYRALLERNQDNRQFYIDFLLNRGLDIYNLTNETRPKVLRALELFQELYPRAGAPVRLGLSIAQGDDFKTLIRQYLSNRLEKGVPSLFSDVKGYYAEQGKREMVEAIVEELKDNLEKVGTLDGSTDHTQPPTTLLWTYYFLALHYSHPSPFNPMPQPTKSLSYLSQAIAHTPTLPELYTARARVLKHSGDLMGAALAMDEARSLDGQDRFLNSKAAKYWIRAGEPEKAQTILGLFTKKDAASPAADLVDMQCFWFVLEEAGCWVEKGRLGMALKRYGQVFKMFDDLEDDEFDFHGYCIRKSTLKAYLKLHKYEGDLRSQENYVKAALAAAKIYVQLADDPELAGRSAKLESNGNGVSAEDAKKAAQKAKKAALKAAADAKKTLSKPAANASAAVDPPAPKDDDPFGLSLAKTSSPLEEAAQILAPLAKSEGVKHRVEVWLAIYEVASRRGKWLQATTALLKAADLDRQGGEVLVQLVHFKLALSNLKDVPEPTASILKSAESTLFPSFTDLKSFVTASLGQSSSAPSTVLGAAKSLHLLQASNDEIEPVAFSLVSANVPLTTVSHAVTGLRLLEKVQSGRVDEFRSQAKARWVGARVFDSIDERTAVREAWLAEERAREERKKAEQGEDN